MHGRPDGGVCRGVCLPVWGTRARSGVKQGEWVAVPPEAGRGEIEKMGKTLSDFNLDKK